MEEVYVLGSQTLQAGGAAVTASGTVLSLLADGSSVVVGGTTTIAASAASAWLGKSGTLATVTQTVSGLGGIIASLGGFEGSEPEVVSATTSIANSSSYEGPAFNGTTAFPWNGTTFTGAGVPRAGASMCWARIAMILIGMRLFVISIT
jgi:hypothetical protein